MKLVGKFMLVMIGCLFMASCVYNPGPPPHAPAHGHRHRVDSNIMIYDSVLGCYRVSSMSNCYYSNYRYYRWYGNQWQSCKTVHGPWKYTRSVPAKLRKRHYRSPIKPVVIKPIPGRIIKPVVKPILKPVHPSGKKVIPGKGLHKGWEKQKQDKIRHEKAKAEKLRKEKAEKIKKAKKVKIKGRKW